MVSTTHNSLSSYGCFLFFFALTKIDPQTRNWHILLSFWLFKAGCWVHLYTHTQTHIHTKSYTYIGTWKTDFYTFKWNSIEPTWLIIFLFSNGSVSIMMPECCNFPWIVDVNCFELWYYDGLKLLLTSYIWTYETGCRNYILLEVWIYSLWSRIPYLLSIFTLSAGPLRNPIVSLLCGHFMLP